jgi:hypothetical protein
MKYFILQVWFLPILLIPSLKMEGYMANKIFHPTNKNKIMGEIIDRAKAPTPKFFKVLRNIGLIMAGVGTVLLTAPISLPATVVTIGGYLVTAGGVATAVSQITNMGDDAIVEKEEGGSDGDGNSS